MPGTQDRTNEFRACVESIRNRSSLPARTVEKQRLLQQGRGDNASEFSRIAKVIAKDISTTSTKLGKLAQRECSFRRYQELCSATRAEH